MPATVICSKFLWISMWMWFKRPKHNVNNVWKMYRRCMFFLSLCDNKKHKPAEINLLIGHSRSSEAHCHLLMRGGRRSVKHRKLTPHFTSSITFDKIIENPSEKKINKTKGQKKNLSYKTATTLKIFSSPDWKVSYCCHPSVLDVESISGLLLSKA